MAPAFSSWRSSRQQLFQEPLFDEPTNRMVGRRILEAQTDEALERQRVAQRFIEFAFRKTIERLQQHCTKQYQHRIALDEVDCPGAEGEPVIGPSGAVRVMVATKPVDFRKGMEGLATLVRESMGADPFSGAVYVFRAKRADRIKLVFWDGTGLCLFAKRLEDGTFRWPKIEDGVMRLSAAQLSALLEGLDWRLVHEARGTPAPAQPG